jgi:hypothetical protein
MKASDCDWSADDEDTLDPADDVPVVGDVMVR